MIILAALSLLTACSKETKIIERVPDSPLKQGNAEPVFQGVINGGGGKGVLCNKDGTQTVELLDLYEAREIYEIHDQKNFDTLDQGIDFLAYEMAKKFWTPITVLPYVSKENVKKTLKHFIEDIKFIEGGKRLKLTDDSYDPLLDENCKVVQLALFYDESKLLVDKGYWDLLSPTGKTALVAHELFYLLDRANNNNNSMRTRKLVGYILSERGIGSMYGFLKPSSELKTARCVGDDFQSGSSIEFFVQRHSVGSYKVAFGEINKHLNLFTAVASFPHAVVSCSPANLCPQPKDPMDIILNPDEKDNFTSNSRVQFLGLNAMFDYTNTSAELKVQNKKIYISINQNNASLIRNLEVRCFSN